MRHQIEAVSHLWHVEGYGEYQRHVQDFSDIVEAGQQSTQRCYQYWTLVPQFFEEWERLGIDPTANQRKFVVWDGRVKLLQVIRRCGAWLCVHGRFSFPATLKSATCYPRGLNQNYKLFRYSNKSKRCSLSKPVPYVCPALLLPRRLVSNVNPLYSLLFLLIFVGS